MTKTRLAERILMQRFLALILAVLICASAQAAPILHSFPGIPDQPTVNKLYLDCTTIPWDATDDAITQTWQIVADYYKPFAVDVTTELPPPQPNVAWLLMGGPLRDGVLGYAGLLNAQWGTLYGPAFAGYVLADGMGDDPIQCGEVAAHEAGHLWGLPHEDSGLMYYGLIPDPMPQWTDFDIGYLGNRLGFAPVPEPQLLLLVGLAFPLLCLRPTRNL